VRKWQATLSGVYGPPTMGPAGTIYFGAYAPYGFYALDFDEVTPKQKWHVDVPNGADVDGAPALAGGRVYYLDSKGQLYARNAATGAEAWAPLLVGDFLPRAPGVTGWLGAPVVTLDTVAVATNLGIRTFSAATGTPGWTYASGKPMSQPALLANGDLVTATLDGSPLGGAGSLAGVVLDRNTGKPVFTFDTGAPLVAPPIVDGKDHVYVSTNRWTRSFDPRIQSAGVAAKRWESALVGSAVLGDGVLYVLGANAFAVIGP
jgi:outer membrane protein assembly factor BamB